MFKPRRLFIKYVFCGLVVFFLIFKVYHYRNFAPYPFLPDQMSANSLLTPDKFQKVFDPAIIKSGNCSVDTKVLLAINSASANFDRRMAIRETLRVWAKERNQTILFFLSNPTDASLRKQIKSESKLYRDIILLPIDESYYLLAFKVLAIMNWARNNCLKIKFLIKSDDDMFINLPSLYKFLESKEAAADTIYGKVEKLTRPIRDWYSRWYMSSTDYPHEFYPDFASGQIYILTADLLPKLLKAASQVKPIYLEDVWITGILREHIPEAKIVHIEKLIALSLLESTVCLPHAYYTIHRITPSQMRYFFKNISNQTSYICSFLYVNY